MFMKESKHIDVNKTKWDRWAKNVDDERGWRNNYLRTAQKDLVDLLELNESTRMLDIGCGTGRALGFAAQKNQGEGNYTGVDLSEKMIAKAKEDFKGLDNFHFLQSNAEAIPLLDNTFDIIICTNSFHHYLHPKKAIKEMSRLLKQKGRVYILDGTTDTRMMKLVDKIMRLFDKSHVKMYSTEKYQSFYTNTGIKYIGNPSIMGPVLVHIGEKI
jgi:ubiquinone/menaquinone biosynthesis C-methylase UbiE